MVPDGFMGLPPNPPFTGYWECDIEYIPGDNRAAPVEDERAKATVTNAHQVEQRLFQARFDVDGQWSSSGSRLH